MFETPSYIVLLGSETGIPGLLIGLIVSLLAKGTNYQPSVGNKTSQGRRYARSELLAFFGLSRMKVELLHRIMMSMSQAGDEPASAQSLKMRAEFTFNLLTQKPVSHATRRLAREFGPPTGARGRRDGS